MAADKGKVFLDSNVVLYLLSENAAKADSAEALLQRRPVISVQVLNEVTHVCVRKLKMGWSEVGQFLALVRGFCSIVPLTVEVHDRARQAAGGISCRSTTHASWRRPQPKAARRSTPKTCTMASSSKRACRFVTRSTCEAA